MSRFIICLLISVSITISIGMARVLNVPDDYETIQAGIDAAEDGDTVLVQPGIYCGGINFSGKAIIVGSLMIMNDDSSYIDSTLVDGNGEVACVVFDHRERESSVLTGFTVRNGRNRFGGGISCLQGTAPRLSWLRITGNRAEHNGGGIHCNNVGPLVEHCRIDSNSAGQFGGGGMSAVNNAHPFIRHTAFTGNRGTDNYDDMDAGGMLVYYSNATLENCEFRGNFAYRMGAGFTFLTLPDPIDSLIMNNCLFTENSIQLDDRGNGYGYAAFLIGRIEEGEQPDIYIEINNTLVVNNSGPRGRSAPFQIGSAFGRIKNCSIVYNQTYSDHRNLFGDVRLSLDNSIFWSNGENIGIALGAIEDVRLAMDYCDIENGREGVSVYGHEELFVWGDSNINSNPLFLDPDNGDYRLSPDSPCIDAGDPDAPPDPDGTRADMGAFYFHQRDIVVEPMAIALITPFGVLDSQQVTISNEGRTPLSISSILLENEMDFNFWWTKPGGNFDPLIEISPDSSLDLWIYFYPIDQGPWFASFTIESDDPDERYLEIVATGEILSVQSDILNSSLFTLHSAYPNPFNSTTRITFSTGSKAATTRLAVYGIDGRMVADLLGSTGVSAGQGIHSAVEGGVTTHSVVWDAEGLPGGIYFVRLEAGNEVRTMKTVLLR